MPTLNFATLSDPGDRMTLGANLRAAGRDSAFDSIMENPDHRVIHDDSNEFDVIGDVHGCFEELRRLVVELGYSVSRSGMILVNPLGRKMVFVGDLVDRGPASPAVLRLVMASISEGRAHCILGNHEAKLFRALSGRDVVVRNGLEQSLAQFAGETDHFRTTVLEFLSNLPTQCVLDRGRLIVAHAGLPEMHHGSSSNAAYYFSIYGEGSVNGHFRTWNSPSWAANYEGVAKVVYGHNNVQSADWLNNTICIDTGCVFGGKLTALRYPEMTLHSVDAGEIYFGDRDTAQSSEKTI
jgi:protein phosphatase